MEPISLNFDIDTIAAVSTPPGRGGVAVIRVSGQEARKIVGSAWKGTDLTEVKSHTAHLGKYINKKGEMLDEALATVFIAPKSFTGEDVVEINIHGSTWIQREILKDLMDRGVRMANPGEFTQRAFLNGKMDLAQAEGVADLISSSSKAAHDIAISQTKGTFSKEFNSLREQLIEFASLLELELDFSEEDVEFADRSKLYLLCKEIITKIEKLANSYSRGAALKNGVPIVIAGVPNAGKSSLLNLLLEDEKAIVADIPGTTRDIIEDTVEIDDILYRFIDTAGIRETFDVVEGIGVQRALAALDKAFIIIWVIDTTQAIEPQLKEINLIKTSHPNKNIIILLNKSDLSSQLTNSTSNFPHSPVIPFSTRTSHGLPELLKALKDITTGNQNFDQDIIITNARHYEALTKALDSLKKALKSLSPTNSEQSTDSCFSPLSADFIAQDIREAITHLSSLTGSITSDTLLHSIFSRFCIGK